MADIRPFAALRYDTSVAGDASGLVAPPYDVVSEADRARLYARSPYNVSHVDYGRPQPGDTEGDDVYSRAARDLQDWREKGVLRLDGEPRLYVYDQEFELEGQTLRRRAVFGRLRLEEWDRGIVLPHEVTGAGAKEDRLRLLRATCTHLSPIMALYENDGRRNLPEEGIGEPVFDAALADERHTLRPVGEDEAQAFCNALTSRRLYVADGHHRYETGLNYRDECKARSSVWTGEEPENFILAALIDSADPGLVVLPTHRLVRLPPREVRVSLRRLFAFRVDDAGVANDGNLERLMVQLAEAGRQGPAFGVIGLEPGRLHLLTPRDLPSLLRRLEHVGSEELRRLDVTILQHAVYPALEYQETPESIAYAEDHRHAAEEVAAGRWDLAFLLNPTPVQQVIAVANAGERMPRKSTYFYPKLGTGVVMLPLE